MTNSNKTKSSKKGSYIGVVGDLHFRRSLGYAELIEDNRISEKKETLDLIVESFKDCNTIVFLGDQLNGRNNLSVVIKEFVQFIERFNDKEVYIIAGNHEVYGDGKSALDFLKEIKNPKRHIITKTVEKARIGPLQAVLCPYFTKSELGTDSNKEATEMVMGKLDKGDILFVHHTISDTFTNSGIQTNIFNEVVLPKSDLFKKYKIVFGGHIHKPQNIEDKLIIAGSVFTNEVGEKDKYVWKLDPSDLSVESIRLPVRPIIKMENPEFLGETVPANGIIKIILTDKKKYRGKLDELKDSFKIALKDGAFIILEQYPNTRKKVHFEEGMLEFNVEDLLGVYAKQKKVDHKKLLRGWEIINK